MEHADPGRPVRLVPGPRVEVRVELAQVDSKLGHRLRSVDHHHGAGVMRSTRDLGDRIDRSDDVGDVDDRDQFRPPRQQRVEGLEVEMPVDKHRHIRELGAAVSAHQLPGHDVRVVLHLGEHHEVAATDVLAAPGVGDEVDRRRRVGREQRLFRRRAQPVGDLPARALVQVRRLDRERVHAPMDRGPRLRVVARHRVDDGLRRLRGRARVQVGDRMAVDLAAEHGKLAGHIAQRGDGRAHAAASSPSVIHP
jgi:hypothetical protein